MLLFIAVLATLSAAFLLFRLTRRHDTELSDQNTLPFEPPLNARPLFMPSADELRLEAKQRQARLIARREYRAKADSRAYLDKALSNWRSVRDRKHAAELLRVSASQGLEGDFSRAADEIIKVFRGPGIAGLTSNDLAALLDSHIGLLSTSERSSGTIFWLKQEVAKLRPEGDIDKR